MVSEIIYRRSLTLQQAIMRRIREVFGNEESYIQKDVVPSHYHCDICSYVNETWPKGWLRIRGSVEYPARSQRLTHLEFSTIKVYAAKLTTIAEMRSPTEQECSQMVLEMLIDCLMQFHCITS